MVHKLGDFLKIFHNPRCSKSRKALEIINSAPHQVILYLNNTLSQEELVSLVSRLQDPIENLVRWKDNNAPIKPDIIDNDSIIDILVANPEVMERPIIDDGENARICRPPDIALSFL